MRIVQFWETLRKLKRQNLKSYIIIKTSSDFPLVITKLHSSVILQAWSSHS